MCAVLSFFVIRIASGPTNRRAEAREQRVPPVGRLERRLAEAQPRGEGQRGGRGYAKRTTAVGSRVRSAGTVWEIYGVFPQPRKL